VQQQSNSRTTPEQQGTSAGASLLPPVEGLEFNKTAHRYCYKGDWLPWSVSSIASPLTGSDLERVMAKKDGPDGWELRGNTIHKALENHLSNKGVVAEERFYKWIDPLLDCWLFNDCEVLAIEYAVCDPVKRVGGSFDFLLRTAQGTLCLGDLKTVGSIHGVKSRKKADAQLGAYSHMLIDLHGLRVDKCVTVVSGPGDVAVKHSDPEECHCKWLEAWDTHRLMQPEW